MSESNLPSYQKDVDEYIKLNEEGYWQPLAMFTALIEETGEIARLINALEGIKPIKIEKNVSKKLYSSLTEEFGDLFFALICLANYFNIDLGLSLQYSINKYKTRDKKRFKINMESNSD
ncbi:MAG: MazG nucleotide pyrophosphohydrolase domain-containing protein [Candidatus Hodarchaeales archaeon]|jgi:NTP pyrophosphatase (non-canonical NTP hydrolase)